MEQEYLIGVNNKFAAFLEEGEDPFEIIKNVEAEKLKKKSVKVALGLENKENKSKDANEVKVKPVKKPNPPKAGERTLPAGVGAKTDNATEKTNNRRNKEESADFPRTGHFRDGKNDGGAPRGRNDNRDRDGPKGDREDRRDGNREDRRDGNREDRRDGNRDRRGDRDGERRDNPRPFRADGERGERRGPRPDGESRPYRPRDGQGEDGEGRPPRRDRRDFGDGSDAEGRGERRGGPGGPRGGRGGPRPPGRNFDNRGKREFDRRSGSDRTGVKPVEKRDGAGSYNWDSTKEPEALIPDMNETNVSDEPDWDSPTKNEGIPAPKDIETTADTIDETAAPVEEEPLELTLDEYRKLRGSRNRPQFDIRKPGEGEDLSKWKNMVEIKKKDSEEEEYEFEISDVPQRAGRQKHVVGIDITFNDSFRGGRGRGGRGAGGGGRPRETRDREPRDGPRRFPPRDRDDRRDDRGDRRDDRGDRRDDRGDRRDDRGDRREDRGDRRDDRGGDRRDDRGDRPERRGDRTDREDRPDRRDERIDRTRPLVPKVDDEKAFPSLG